MTDTIPTEGKQLFSTVTADGRLELALRTVPVAEPGEDEVLIRVDAAPINPSDLGVMLTVADGDSFEADQDSASAPIPEKLARAVAARVGLAIPIGNEGAGLVVKAGASPAAQALLGKIVALAGGGMYATYRTAKAAACMVVPEGISAEEGASSFVNPLTALSMIGTMRLDGYKALIHTAAASNLGQMLIKLCLAEGVELVNIVRSEEQVDLLKGLGAKYVCDSSTPDFAADLTTAIAETQAFLAFDATGGGRLANQILTAMEAAALKTQKANGPYGSTQYKQVYLYGGLNTAPTELTRGFGMSWGIGGYLLTYFLQRVGPEETKKLRDKIAAALKTTFASAYTSRITLAEAIDPATIAAYSKRATGEKYLILPQGTHDHLPLATPFPVLPAIPGVTPRIARAHYKTWDRCDLTFVTLDEGTTVAGVTTQSRCPSPEVEWCRKALTLGQARALVVNAGNANAFTGARGRAAVEAIAARTAAHLGCQPSDVFVASTGVIGVPLPIDKAEAGLDAAFTADVCSWRDATDTIGTTDTFPKAATTAAIVGGRTVNLVGIIKGSGMIAPDMATMLGFIFTDAAVSPEYLQGCLAAANATTFSCITVDSDTSTSDTVLAFATAKAGNAPLTSSDDDGADAFAAALADLCRQLAHLVVRDGEGATKFIRIDVTGAESDRSARAIAMSIANSPLVKTAIAGEDANWGRVVMAVGKAGEPAERDSLSIRFGDTQVAKGGLAVEGYDEAPVAAHLKGSDVEIGVDLGLGDGKATVWTCDLTHGYISINADYRS